VRDVVADRGTVVAIRPGRGLAGANGRPAGGQRGRSAIVAAVQHTAQDSDGVGGERDAPVPGLLVVWSGEEPAMTALRLPPAGLVLGRELLSELPETRQKDDRISRLHARVRPARPPAQGFTVTDLGSRNGSFVDGRPLVDGEIAAGPGAIVRAGRTLAVLCADVRPFENAAISIDGDVVAGPTLRAAWRAAERAGRSGDTLLVTGESGAGKELAARAFHQATGATGPLIAVNCAAIPATVAERLLFGTRRGAYSGADRDADGYIATADGGTLFLDEIADLDLQVQAKLLRVIETGELLPLGAARPTPVTIKVVAATLRDLRAEVAARKFRDDLYYRIGRPEVAVPALRERREEIPHLVARVAAAAAIGVHPSLIEACLIRPWPGNVRELLGEVRRAALAAKEDGKPFVRAEDLDARAGIAIAAAEAVGGETVDLTRGSAARPAPLPTPAVIEEALRAHAGNVSAASRALGLHRNQLRRFLSRNPAIAKAGGVPDEDPDADQGD
jgi:transcriptional regulator with AAA-type ATPase domain